MYNKLLMVIIPYCHEKFLLIGTAVKGGAFNVDVDSHLCLAIIQRTIFTRTKRIQSVLFKTIWNTICCAYVQKTFVFKINVPGSVLNNPNQTNALIHSANISLPIDFSMNLYPLSDQTEQFDCRMSLLPPSVCSTPKYVLLSTLHWLNFYTKYHQTHLL